MRLYCVKKSDNVLRIESADCPVLAHCSQSKCVLDIVKKAHSGAIKLECLNG
jgi:hypothetical protein